MIASKLISNTLNPIPDSLIEKDAHQVMNNARIFHLPVVSKDNIFLGLLAEEEIDLDSNRPLSDVLEKLSDTKVYAHQHAFEIFETVFSQKLSCIPVVDENNLFVGIISCFDLMVYFGEISALESPGATIVLSVVPHDYSLSQITQIIEETNTKILSLFTNNLKDSNEIEIILKLNTHEISAILQTFSRYEYTVKTYFEGYDKLQEMYKDRIDSLLNYLNT